MGLPERGGVFANPPLRLSWPRPAEPSPGQEDRGRSSLSQQDAPADRLGGGAPTRALRGSREPALAGMGGDANRMPQGHLPNASTLAGHPCERRNRDGHFADAAGMFRAPMWTPRGLLSRNQTPECLGREHPTGHLPAARQLVPHFYSPTRLLAPPTYGCRARSCSCRFRGVPRSTRKDLQSHASR